MIVRLARAPRLRLAGEPLLDPLPDHRPLFLGDGRVNVQHERLDLGAELGDDESNLARHEAGDEHNVTREPIERGDDDGAFQPASFGEGGLELRPALQCVGTLGSQTLQQS